MNNVVAAGAADAPTENQMASRSNETNVAQRADPQTPDGLISQRQQRAQATTKHPPPNAVMRGLRHDNHLGQSKAPAKPHRRRLLLQCPSYKVSGDQVLCKRSLALVPSQSLHDRPADATTATDALPIHGITGTASRASAVETRVLLAEKPVAALDKHLPRAALSERRRARHNLRQPSRSSERHRSARRHPKSNNDAATLHRAALPLPPQLMPLPVKADRLLLAPP